MNNLLSLAEFLKNYANAIDIGFNKFVQSSPVFVKQHIEKLAKRKLSSTRDAYIEAVKSKLSKNVLVVELDRESWIANAVESGISDFDMKAGHLKSPKAKMSKKGYRYMVIPIGKDPSISPKTEKGQEFQQKVKQALAQKKFGIKKLKADVNGGVFETQEVLSDVGLDGFYRYRKFESIDSYHQNKNKKQQWQYVLFRVMSENPESKSKWQHPGIQPVHIFKETERFFNENATKMIEGFIDAEIEKIISSYKGQGNV